MKVEDHLAEEKFALSERSQNMMVRDRAVRPVLFLPRRQVAAEDAAVLNQLLAAYKRIGLKLPTLDLSNALKAHLDCQQALALAGEEQIASRLIKAREERERRHNEIEREDEEKSIIERHNVLDAIREVVTGFTTIRRLNLGFSKVPITVFCGSRESQGPDLLTISRRLRTRSSIDLSQERVAIESAISSFVHATIAQSPLLCDTESIDKKVIDRIEQTLLSMADGMFLWVRLVVSTIENAYTVEQMLQALDRIPRGLEDLVVAENLSYRLLTLKLAITSSSSGSKR
ncbi:uncharacterized protein A1O9_03135 [Exophiala aquamarina CBS 119918]|uniref:Uncharacterized protein n=1 Tax=Exophiala aquamarina CBS 119918 TaxID=1182545 RepID=A0A072PP90_9EURO|nr:uncharacterized protein A1O9_03135 [Exophiala aquamarina CBS 119918]KEF61567.1 hypothetical protein A1O9_03135 [Exophiala aquamarina CBS 119918]